MATTSANMATTSANINSGITLATKNGNNICHIPTLVIITITHQCPKIAGHTNTLTPSVLEIIKINIFFRPGRSHVRNWQKLVLSLKILVLLKRIFDLQNVLRFGYRVNFRYEGMLAHSFDRFYVVTRIEIPKVLDLNLTVFQFDYNCSHVTNIEKDTRFKIPDMIKDMFSVCCKNIIPYMYLYKHQVECYEKTVYNILEKDIGMILPKIWKYRK